MVFHRSESVDFCRKAREWISIESVECGFPLKRECGFPWRIKRMDFHRSKSVNFCRSESVEFH